MASRANLLNLIALFVLYVHIDALEKKETMTRPVYEEETRMERRMDRRPKPPTNQNYGNPFKNAKLHAKNQQAMFNAEKARKQMAQSQKSQSNKRHKDSYVETYYALQERQQALLEQMWSDPRYQQYYQGDPYSREFDYSKYNLRGQVRNHRSQGSFRPTAQTVHITPASVYDEGVTIRPNGIVGLADNQKVQSKLYTTAIPSTVEYVYPKQNLQMQNYLSDNNNEFKIVDVDEKDQNVPIDYYFYLKDSSPFNIPQYNEFFKQMNHSLIDAMQREYASKFAEALTTSTRNYIPVTEESFSAKEIRNYGSGTTFKKPKMAKYRPKKPVFNNIHELISGKTQKPVTNDFLISRPDHYESSGSVKTDNNFRYLHHNIRNKGVLHLNEDGNEVAAYDNEEARYAANYEFGYRIQDPDSNSDFGHSESMREGRKTGQYHVLLPDGRMQNVKYQAGPEGFHADISYDHLQMGV